MFRGPFGALVLYGFALLVALKVSPEAAPFGRGAFQRGASPSGLTVLHVFASHPDGALPNGVVRTADGSLYGTTFYGGRRSPPCGFGCGSVFRLAPPASTHGLWTETILHSFANGPSDGAYPFARVLVGRDGTLYGVTSSGGLSNSACSDCGVAFSLTPPKRGKAWSETILHFFEGAPRDGADPLGDLVIGSDGALYGTTAHGGSANTCDPTGYRGCGTVFKLTPPAPGKLRWREQVMYSFKGPPKDGMWPTERLVLAGDGSFYGTTQDGGSGNSTPDCVIGQFTSGCGTVFKLSPPDGSRKRWKETVLHSFAGPPGDGAAPTGLLLEKNRTIYGTAAYGGAGSCAEGNAGCGIAFALVPPSSAESIIYSFGSAVGDGAVPTDDLIPDGKGGFYGTTADGGTGTCDIGNGCGTAYELTPYRSAWVERILHEFNGPSDGEGPSDLIAAGHLFYGTAFYGGSSPGCRIGIGCGTAFMLRR